jgi:dynein heavy chain
MHRGNCVANGILPCVCLYLQCLMVPWDDKVPKFTYSPGGEASSLFVPTVETTRLSYFLDSLVANR